MLIVSRRIPLALVSALFLLALLASTALAGTPSTVTVRVVGLTGTTLLPQTQVTTTSTPIVPDGTNICSSTSAGGALYDAIRGNWVVKYDGAELGYEIDGIQGLNLPPFSSTPDAYWSFWLNGAPSSTGACGQELTQGNDVVFFAQCDAMGINCPTSETSPDHFLTEAVPASSSVQVGTPVSVTVGSLSTATGKAESSLPSGVTVTAGSLSAAPNAQGVATLSFPNVGTYTIQAAAADSVPSDPVTVCVHNGNDGTCETTVAKLPSVPPAIVPPALPDAARVVGVQNGRVYSRRAAPRILKGSVEVPAGGTLREVRIALERSAHHRCFAFSGRRGAFVRASCHATRFFDVADTTSFSYLLPARLPAGHYVYDIEAVDDAGHVTKLAGGVSHVVFYVK
ncbi:MAG: hypothetical protein ACRDLF_11520 [Solirubrobacteraceae bacterium]